MAALLRRGVTALVQRAVPTEGQQQHQRMVVMAATGLLFAGATAATTIDGELAFQPKAGCDGVVVN
jgi:hypothetical protein